MAAEVLMPKLGATMESGTIMRWFKQEGDKVRAGEPLIEIMTDKVNIEVEAEVSGILLKIHYQPDEEVAVNQVIGFIGESNGQLSEAVQQDPGEANEPIQKTSEQIKPRSTPAAKQMAHIYNVDLQQVKGTGPKGRIHRNDIEKYVEESKPDVKAARIVSAEIEDQLQELPPIDVTPVTPEKIKGKRKVIAQRMVQSAFSAPHITLVSEVDMTNAILLRNQLVSVIEKQTGYRLSYTEIIMKVVAFALRKHPKINASLEDDYIILNSCINIGLAVSVPDGLMVPVVKDADQKGLESLTSECKKMAVLCREGKLRPEQLAGGTFTISNLGMYAVDAFTPIINQPESAILGIGRINEKAVGINGVIELRSMMTLSLSFDHRVIDGAPAAAFLTEVKGILENPYQLLM